MKKATALSNAERFKLPNALAQAGSDNDLAAAVLRGRKMLRSKALMAAVAGALPIPGLDWMVDAALLSRLIPALNEDFGLSPEQIARLDPARREKMHKAVAVVGSALIGRLLTREAVIRAAKVVGVRLGAAQAAKYVPLAGQALAAAAGYGAIRYFGEQHMRDCVRVIQLSRGEADVDVEATTPIVPRRRLRPAA